MPPPAVPPATDPASALLERFLALVAAGDFAGALPVIERLAALLPDSGRIHGYHGFTLERLERADDALAAYGRALALDPGYLDARYNRACLLARRNDPAAEAAFAELIARAPDHPGAAAALATLSAQRLQPRFDEARTRARAGDRAGAEAVYRAILAELPDNVPVLHNLATLVGTRDPQDAIRLWQRALTLEPDNLEARAALGQFLFAQGHVAAALPHLEAVVAHRPDHTAIAELVQAQADLAAWPELARLTPRLIAAIQAGTPVTPLAAVRFADDPALVLAAGRHFTAHVLGQAFPGGVAARRHVRPATAPATSPGRLTIGYLSSDLRGHIIGLLLAAVIERHDRARFAVHAYQLGRRVDPTTERIRAAVAGYADVSGLTPEQVATRIAADRVDVLIEMNGWTRDGRSEALAARPAPVQLQWLGYAGTSGSAFVDYVIADDVTVPPGDERWYTEKILRLPGTHQPFDPALIPSARPTRDELGLPEGALVLAALVPHWKITPPVFAVWMQALRALPDAVLWLADGAGAARHNLTNAAAAHGVAAERLVFARRVPMREFLGALAAADLFVDTFPYGGHSTASGALFAGLPVVALAGQGFAGRVAASVLRAAALESLVTRDLDGYARTILQLGRDRGALGRLRAELAAKRATAPLFDLERFVRALERGYEAAWARWHAGQPADHITVVGV
ncbi:MAG: tetratricopeptide repeat protein [Proteobacteria bacterium]|nr:tetratricopeptide repeat protein [Pseudomonadota bacterium]